MPDPLKPIGADLGKLFRELESRVQKHVAFADRVRELVDCPEKEHVVSASYRGDTLVVIADSAAWASRIRFSQDALLARVNEAGATQFTKLKVRVGRKISG